MVAASLWASLLATAAALAAPPQQRTPLVAPLLDVPVYSLATLNGDGSTNMNILTYASPMGIRPERLWQISLYRGTRTHANFAARRCGVLQLCRGEHAAVTHALGGVSSEKDAGADKAAACAAAGLAWEPACAAWDELVLPRCAAYVKLEALPETTDCGDHEVFTCKVVGGFGDDDGSDAHLKTGELRRLGLISTKGAAVAPGDVAPAEAPIAAAASFAARRAAAASFAFALALSPPAPAVAAAPLKLGECRTSTSALYSTRTCLKFGTDKDGRLRSCLPSENCVSTSAIKSPAQFSAPWAYSPRTSDAKVAFVELVDAIKAAPDLRLEEADDAALYVHATADTVVKGGRAVDRDDLEFVVDGNKGYVFYRSASRESIFFFPAQNIYSVPLSDDGTNFGRLEGLRKKLGWESLGARSEDADDSPSSYEPLRR